MITWFDNFCVLLRRDGQSQLVYKHVNFTVMPAQPISLYDGDGEAELAFDPHLRPAEICAPARPARH